MVGTSKGQLDGEAGTFGFPLRKQVSMEEARFGLSGHLQHL